MESPYEYYLGKLGVKLSFLISDSKPDSKKQAHPDSLRLICYRSLKHRMDSHTCLEKQLRERSYHITALVEFHSLSQDWQSKLIARFGHAPANIKKRYFETQYEYDLKAYNFYSREYTEGVERRMLTHEKIEEYTFNASVLNTVRKVKENRTQFRKQLGSNKKSDIWQILSSEVNSFNEVPHTLPVSPDGLRKKLVKFEKEGYVGLIDGRRNNDNARKVDADVIKLLNELFAGQEYKPTATAVAKMYNSFLDGYIQVINKETAEFYEPSNFKKLSDATITNYLSDWENTIATHQIRGGNRQLNMTKFKPHHQMDLPTFSGSLLSIDDRQPPFYYEPGKRAWFYIGVDVASGCFTGYVHGKSKEGIILEFYRQLVRNYTEWGLPIPYELECESSLNSSFKGTFLQEGAMFQKVRIEANNARGKYIERVFGKLRYEVEKSAIGWAARPFAISEANQSGNKQLPIIPYDQLIEERYKEMEDWNNSSHPLRPELTRFEYLLEMYNKEVPSTNWRAILPHLGKHEQSSCNVGKIILQNKKRFIADNGEVLLGESLIAKMKRIEGEKVDVYWLDGNDGNVLKAVVFLNGEYICELVSLSYQRAQIEQTPEDIAIRELQSKYTASVEAFAKLQKRSIDKVVVIDHQQKTLNRRFQISGLNRFQTREEEVEELEDNSIEEFDYIPSTGTGTAKSFKDNFKF